MPLHVMKHESKKFKYIYGPVPSWRLGRSLGIDLIAGEKTCSFDCIYCQLGPTKDFAKRRKIFAPTKDVLKEIKTLPPLKLDYITISGGGEPTLARNLGEVIKGIRRLRREPVAVLTNASLIYRRDVRSELKNADLVVAKLDASSQGLLKKINKPTAKIKFSKIVEGIKKLKKDFRGRLALQIMFVKENKPFTKELLSLAREINPDEVQINTPLRPCDVTPLSRNELINIKKAFAGMRTFMVYEAKKARVKALDTRATLKRRPEL